MTLAESTFRRWCRGRARGYPCYDPAMTTNAIVGQAVDNNHRSGMSLTHRCPGCHRITRSTAASKHPTAKFRTREPTPDAPVRVQCPHCDEPNCIGSDDEFWFCACQICQCPDTVMTPAAA